MKKFILPLIILTFFVACAYNAEVANDAYDTLEEATLAYDISMKATADVYKQGYIDEERKAEIIKAMDIYQAAHNSSVAILKAYGKYSDEEIEKLKIKPPAIYFEEKND